MFQLGELAPRMVDHLRRGATPVVMHHAPGRLMLGKVWIILNFLQPMAHLRQQLAQLRGVGRVQVCDHAILVRGTGHLLRFSCCFLQGFLGGFWRPLIDLSHRAAAFPRRTRRARYTAVGHPGDDPIARAVSFLAVRPQPWILQLQHARPGRSARDALIWIRQDLGLIAFSPGSCLCLCHGFFLHLVRPKGGLWDHLLTPHRGRGLLLCHRRVSTCRSSSLAQRSQFSQQLTELMPHVLSMRIAPLSWT
mmetsp:Transcript_80603/g.127314  ORF Transcript_80603/g.127314 Transcript_80603/m.127314 type:complete len:249 (-) Transcript_80603:200-946(-)